MSMNRVIIAGGGTGGHIFPALAIADAIKRKYDQAEILFVGAEGKMEMEKVPLAGYPIKALPIVGFERKKLWKNWSLPFKLLQSQKMAKEILQEFPADLVIGVGGFASFPMLRAAQKSNIPTFIQEQNSFAGKSNKILGKEAGIIFVAYEGMESFFPKDKIVMSGNPIRKQIKENTWNQNSALTSLGLASDKKTILAVGGSLGALSINQAMERNFEDWLSKDYQIIWQTGKNYSIPDAFLNRSGAVIQTFFQDIEKAYSAADIIVSRAGALACAELALMSKPVIFVPYPFAAEDHQTQNAHAFVNAGAALLIEDQKVKEELGEKVHFLLENEEVCQKMGNKMSYLAQPNAEHIIINQIEHYLEGS